MSDLDVSLRLRLLNQLSRPAEEAERDLKELQAVAERLGRIRGGDQLGRNLEAMGRAASDAKGKLGALSPEAETLRQKLGQLNNTRGLESLKQDASQAKAALSQTGQQVQELKAKLGSIGGAASEARAKIELLDDTSALTKLRQEAQQAEQAIRGIGSAVPGVKASLDPLSDPWRRGNQPIPRPQQDPRHGRLGQGIEGIADRSGVDAILPIGASGGYMIGAGIGGAIVGIGSAYKRFAGDDRETEYILMNMGVPQADGPSYRSQVRDIAQDQRVPYRKTIEGLNALAATGLPVDDIMKMLPGVMRTSLASNAEPADVAATAFAIRDKMKVAPTEIQAALDAVVGGGNMGQFEVPDMARYLPTILSYSSQAGLTGVEGLRKTIAMLQAVRKDTGDSSTAATNLQNVFAKMRSEETERNFKEYGVNLPAAFKKGRKEGKDDPEILYEAAMKASKGGNADILARLFVDQQAYLGLLSLVKNKDQIKSDTEALASQSGVVDEQWGRVSNDPQAALDALSNSANRATVAIGGLADSLGLTSMLNGVARAVEETTTAIQDPQTYWERVKAAFAKTNIGKAFSEPEAPRQSDDEFQKLLSTRAQLEADLAAVKAAGASSPQTDESINAANDYRRSHGVPFEGGMHRAGREAGPQQAIERELSLVGAAIAREIAKFRLNDRAPNPEEGPIPGISKPQQLPIEMPAPLARPMADAAQEAMGAYNNALEAEGSKAVGIAQSIADQLRSMLSFTAGPTIRPNIVAPRGGGISTDGAPKGVGGRQTAELGGSTVKVTQHISAPNSQLAAARAQRAQNRAVRMAQWDAIGDMGNAFG